MNIYLKVYLILFIGFNTGVFFASQMKVNQTQRALIEIEKRVYTDDQIQKCLDRGGEYSAIINSKNDWRKCDVTESIDLNEKSL